MNDFIKNMVTSLNRATISVEEAAKALTHIALLPDPVVIAYQRRKYNQSIRRLDTLNTLLTLVAITVFAVAAVLANAWWLAAISALPIALWIADRRML